MTRAFLITGSILAAFAMFVSCEINNPDNGSETPADKTEYTMCSVDLSETTGGAFDKLVFKDKDHYILCKDKENGLPDRRVIQCETDTLGILYNEYGLPEVLSDGTTYVFIGGYSGTTARICAVGPEGTTDVEEIELDIDVDEYLSSVNPTKAETGTQPTVQQTNIANLIGKSIGERTWELYNGRGFSLGRTATGFYIAEALLYMASPNENYQKLVNDTFVWGGITVAIVQGLSGANPFYALAYGIKEVWYDRFARPLWDGGYLFLPSDPRSPYSEELIYFYHHIGYLVFGTYHRNYPWYGDTFENEIITDGTNYNVQASDFIVKAPEWIVTEPVSRDGRNYLSVYCQPNSESGAEPRSDVVTITWLKPKGGSLSASFGIDQGAKPCVSPESLTLSTKESRRVNIRYAVDGYEIYDSPPWCRFTTLQDDYFEVQQDPAVESPQPGTIIVAIPSGKSTSGKDTFVPIMIDVLPESKNCPDDNHPHAIDMGTGVKWACCNVGASVPTDYGDYFAWGETDPKSYYNWNTYKWCNGSYTTITKYNTVDNTELDSEDDVAHVKLGGNWRMPTDAEWTELCTQCTWTWRERNHINDIAGASVTATNGNSIFLPAAGGRFDAYLNSAGSSGHYWSSSLRTDYLILAWGFHFGPNISANNFVFKSNVNRCEGQSVRPVSD
jgi:hypothetical protein